VTNRKSTDYGIPRDPLELMDISSPEATVFRDWPESQVNSKSRAQGSADISISMTVKLLSTHRENRAVSIETGKPWPRPATLTLGGRGSVGYMRICYALREEGDAERMNFALGVVGWMQPQFAVAR